LSYHVQNCIRFFFHSQGPDHHCHQIAHPNNIW
jgi:hypothetical protein